MDTKELHQMIIKIASDAKAASRHMGILSSEKKAAILKGMADALIKQKDEILFQNEIDVEAAKESSMSEALIDRLTLNEARLNDVARGLREVAAQEDPVGEIIKDWTPPSGIHVQQVRVPLGVIAMIYESRPNVTVDAAGLCLKAGNAIILRGGSEAVNSNHILVKIITEAGYKFGMPEGAIQFIPTTDRQAIMDLIKLDSLVDLVIPRGGAEMIRAVRENATVPVLAHGKGLCHVYIDKDADLAMAKSIALNAKCQRPGVCNAMESLLVHEAVANKLMPDLCKSYFDAGVEVRGCALTKKIVPDVKLATDKDWDEEYLGLIVSAKIIGSLREAIDHINAHGSGHSEAIVTNDQAAADEFLRDVDAAAVLHNASTRMHDGGVFGLGAEIGTSTQKLHARGTMGVKELTTTKYIVHGTGQIRQ